MAFHYLSPLILPILPRLAGATLCSMNLQRIIDELAITPTDVQLTLKVETFVDGQLTRERSFQIKVKAGVPEMPYFTESFESDLLGYAQVSITADRPHFRRVHTEHVYSLVRRPDNGTFILNAAYKFSDPLIIDLMRRVNRFCLVHPAHYVSSAENIGNSALIINPFDGPVIATIATSRTRRLRQRIAPRTASMISLEKLIDDGRFTCVLYTGNNRFPAWDVRHSLSDPSRINRIDHLEFFRGDETLRRMPLKRFVGSKIRRLMRDVGLRRH